MVQQTARVVAEVEDHAIDVLNAASLFDLFLQTCFEVGEGLVAESRDTQNDGFAFSARANGGELDGIADNRHIERLGSVLAHQRQDRFGADRTAHQLDRFVERQAK